MSSAKERAKALAQELRQTVQQAKAAEANAQRLSEELVQALAEARAEAAAALTLVEYPAGRYVCEACRHSTIFTEPTRELPECQNCGNRKWTGHAPTITKIEPPPPKKYSAGMYQCAGCGARTGVLADTDELSPCELCGSIEVKPLL